jgi:hypothetical protein
VSVYYPPDGQPIPPLIDDPIGAGSPPGIFESKSDSAKFIVQLRRFRRPRVRKLSTGDGFVWPGGSEGVTISGSAKLGIHTYIGDGNADVQVVHRNEGRIEMSGRFLGKTAAANVRLLKNILTQTYLNTGLKLDLPGIFTYEHDVFCENYEFVHEESEISQDWTYRIVFVDAAHSKKRIPPAHAVRPPPNPRGTKKGTPPAYLVVKDGMRTLRAISKKAFGNVNKWHLLYDANRKTLDQIMADKHIAFALLPTTLLPLGLKIYLHLRNETVTYVGSQVGEFLDSGTLEFGSFDDEDGESL